MAEALYLVTRTAQGVNDDKNLVREVIVNDDDGTSDADIITATIALMNAALGADADAPVVYPAGYFDTVVLLSDLTGTTQDNLRTDGDFIAFAPRVTAVVTAAA